MAWTAPSTWSTGDVSAAAFNAMMADLAELAPGIISASGDIAYADAANSLARLPAGESGQILRGGTTPAWKSLPDTRNNVATFSDYQTVEFIQSTAGAVYFTHQTGTTGGPYTKVVAHMVVSVQPYTTPNSDLDMSPEISLNGGGSWTTAEWLRVESNDRRNQFGSGGEFAKLPVLLQRQTTGSSTGEIQVRYRYKTSTTGKILFGVAHSHVAVFT